MSGEMIFIRVLGAVTGVTLLAQAPQPDARAPIPALVEALKTHSVVGIGELHGCRQAGDFYIALVRDPEFQRVVNDIVIEFASGQSQPLLDRYILALDTISLDTLRSIWRNTTKAASWDFPTYERWLKAIRDVNRSLPARRRIRVLAGDTPVEWSRLRTQEDWTRLGDNNATFATLISDQVIGKRRKALVVLGNNHLARGGTFRDRAPNAASLIEKRFPGSMYLVLIYYGGFGDDSADSRIAREKWQVPAIVPLADSWLGKRPIPTSAGQLPLSTFADALLYLGKRNALTIERPAVATFDAAYRRELVRRSWIEFGDSTRLRRLIPD